MLTHLLEHSSGLTITSTCATSISQTCLHRLSMWKTILLMTTVHWKSIKYSSCEHINTTSESTQGIWTASNAHHIRKAYSPYTIAPVKCNQQIRFNYSNKNASRLGTTGQQVSFHDSTRTRTPRRTRIPRRLWPTTAEVGVSSQVVALLRLQETLYNSVINLIGAVLRYPYTGRVYEISSSSNSLCWCEYYYMLTGTKSYRN